jgi:Flp pilus assembly protein TadG
VLPLLLLGATGCVDVTHEVYDPEKLAAVNSWYVALHADAETQPAEEVLILGALKSSSVRRNEVSKFRDDFKHRLAAHGVKVVNDRASADGSLTVNVTFYLNFYQHYVDIAVFDDKSETIAMLSAKNGATGTAQIDSAELARFCAEQFAERVLGLKPKG